MKHATMPAQGTPAAHPATLLPLVRMASLRRLMLQEGWSVDLARMCVDSAYAYECLALAHTSSDERLRRTALEIFSAYDCPAAVVMH